MTPVERRIGLTFTGLTAAFFAVLIISQLVWVAIAAFACFAIAWMIAGRAMLRSITAEHNERQRYYTEQLARIEGRHEEIP